MKNFLLMASFLMLLSTTSMAEEPCPSEDGPQTRQKIEFHFVKMDTNGDGVVTRDEMRAYTDKMFDDADTKHDGKLTIDELFDQKMRDKTAFKEYQGKNTSDTSNAKKDREAN